MKKELLYLIACILFGGYMYLFPSLLIPSIYHKLLLSSLIIAIGYDFLKYKKNKLTYDLINPIRRFFGKNRKVMFSCLLLLGTYLLNFSFLIEKWTSDTPTLLSISNPTIGGYLPYSDAAGYFTEGVFLVEYGQLFGKSLWRPLGHIFNANLLAITGLDLKMTLVLICCITSFSIFWLSNMIYKTMGVSASIISLLLLSDYNHFITGIYMTEPVGFILGNIACAFLLKCIFSKKQIHFFIGVFMLSLAMTVRPSSVLIIPVVAVWSGWFFRKKKYDFKPFVISIILFVSIMTSSILMGNFLSNASENTSQGNLSYIVYALTKGGQHWNEVRNQHPELRRMSLSQQNKAIYSYAKEEFEQKPLAFFNAVGKIYARSILFIGSYLLGFVNNAFIQMCIYFAIIFLLIIAVLYRKLESHSILFNVCVFVLVSIIGILLSSPFVEGLYTIKLESFTDSHSSRNRLYAGVVSFNVLLIVTFTYIGMKAFAQKLNLSLKYSKKINSKVVKTDLFIPLIFFITILVSPFYYKWFKEPVQFSYPNNVCNDNKGNIGLLMFTPNTYIHVNSNKEKGMIAPEISVKSFMNNNPSAKKENIYEISNKKYLVMAHDFKRGFRIFVEFSEDISKYEGIRAVCVEPVSANFDLLHKATSPTYMIK